MTISVRSEMVGYFCAETGEQGKGGYEVRFCGYGSEAGVEGEGEGELMYVM